MTFNGILQIAIFCIVVIALVRPLGGYMTRVFNGDRNFLSPVLRPVERLLYAASGVKADVEQSWLVYGVAMLLFSLAGSVSLYAIFRFQDVLPLNPQGFPAVGPDLAFNTSISFITNTNWQNYGGESTMSYLVQMLGLTHQNYLSAATEIGRASCRERVSV